MDCKGSYAASINKPKNQVKYLKEFVNAKTATEVIFLLRFLSFNVLATQMIYNAFCSNVIDF